MFAITWNTPEEPTHKERKIDKRRGCGESLQVFFVDNNSPMCVAGNHPATVLMCNPMYCSRFSITGIFPCYPRNLRSDWQEQKCFSHMTQDSRDVDTFSAEQTKIYTTTQNRTQTARSTYVRTADITDRWTQAGTDKLLEMPISNPAYGNIYVGFTLAFAKNLSHV